MLRILATLAVLENRLLARLETRDETGAAVIEYGIIVAVIALGLVTVGQGLVAAVGTWFAAIALRVQGLPS